MRKGERVSASSGIELRGLAKVFGAGAGATVALESIDLTIAPGEFLAVVGPSGCGKSTLLRLIAGLTPATAGDIGVSGRPIRGPLHDVGVVFQAPILLDWRDVLGNVLFQIDMRGLDVETYKPRA